jgi:hypothetical protein
VADEPVHQGDHVVLGEERHQAIDDDHCRPAGSRRASPAGQVRADAVGIGAIWYQLEDNPVDTPPSKPLARTNPGGSAMRDQRNPVPLRVRRTELGDLHAVIAQRSCGFADDRQPNES